MTKVKINVSVAAHFLSQIIFVFLLFLGMVMHANEVEKKKKKKITWNKKLTTTYPFLSKPFDDSYGRWGRLLPYPEDSWIVRELLGDTSPFLVLVGILHFQLF